MGPIYTHQGHKKSQTYGLSLAADYVLHSTVGFKSGKRCHVYNIIMYYGCTMLKFICVYECENDRGSLLKRVWICKQKTHYVRTSCTIILFRTSWVSNDVTL